jgi:hypothetical protein
MNKNIGFKTGVMVSLSVITLALGYLIGVTKVATDCGGSCCSDGKDNECEGSTECPECPGEEGPEVPPGEGASMFFVAIGVNKHDDGGTRVLPIKRATGASKAISGRLGLAQVECSNGPGGDVASPKIGSVQPLVVTDGKDVYANICSKTSKILEGPYDDIVALAYRGDDLLVARTGGITEYSVTQLAWTAISTTASNPEVWALAPIRRDGGDIILALKKLSDSVKMQRLTSTLGLEDCHSNNCPTKFNYDELNEALRKMPVGEPGGLVYVPGLGSYPDEFLVFYDNGDGNGKICSILSSEANVPTCVDTDYGINGAALVE